MEKRRRGIALVAHDGKKKDLCEWAAHNRDALSIHDLYATGTTGTLLRQRVGLTINCLNSGPLGGDQQIGSRIVEGVVDVLIFFQDPLGLHPHIVDIRALERLAVLRGIPVACNRGTADYIITSPLLTAA